MKLTGQPNCFAPFELAGSSGLWPTAMAKVKDFQKAIVDDIDWKETISGEHVCACPIRSDCSLAKPRPQSSVFLGARVRISEPLAPQHPTLADCSHSVLGRLICSSAGLTAMLPRSVACP